MTHSLDGARLKVVRAQEHLDSLKAEVAMYIDEHPYEVISADNDTQTYRFTRMLRITNPPPLRLSTILGDCVTNARAALDYICWELAARYFSPSVDISNRNDRKIVSFPICLGPTDKGHIDHLNSLAARKVPARAIDEIKAVQPQNAGYESLLYLHKLVNTDKHRMPILTLAAIGNFVVSLSDSWEAEVNAGNCTMYSSGASGLSGHAGTDSITAQSDDMYMNLQASIYITLQDVSMPREPVDRTLGDIVKHVAHIVPRFDQFF